MFTAELIFHVLTHYVLSNVPLRLLLPHQVPSSVPLCLLWDQCRSGPVEVKCHLSFYPNMSPLASIWYCRDRVREVERKLVVSVTGLPRLDYTQDCSGNLKIVQVSHVYLRDRNLHHPYFPVLTSEVFRRRLLSPALLSMWKPRR